jgi:3-mercaptopyruvate sulfurtransferase SseA
MKKRSLWAFSFILTLTLLLLPGYAGAVLKPSQAAFPNAGLLVSAASLQSSFGEAGLIIIDARTSGYETSHIPGAINVKFGDYFTWGQGLLPVDQLNSMLGAKGLARSLSG